MKKWLGALLCVSLLLFFCGCSKQEVPETTVTEATTSAIVETTEAPPVPVGLCLPNQTDARWIEAGAALKEALEAKGYQVLLEDAQEDVSLQTEQIGKLTEEKVQCLVVAAVDSAGLSQCLALTKKAGIPVIAYDRLLVNTDGVAGYVSFDYQSIGKAVAQSMIASKSLETAQAENRSYTVEFLMDTYQNHANVLYYQGLTEGLKSYLDAGVLVCPSGRISFEDVCVKTAEPATLQARCEDLLTDHYKEAWPEILVTGNDVLSDAWVAALNARQCPAENWPVITGQMAAAETAPEQMLAVNYDGTALAQTCANAVDAVLSGKAVGAGEIGNGATGVPAELILPEITVPEREEPPQAEAETVPEETTSEETVPEETLPEETLIEETISEETQPQETAPEETVENPAA